MREHSGRWARRAAIALIAAGVVLPAQASAVPQARELLAERGAAHAERPVRLRPRRRSACRASSRSPSARGAPTPARTPDGLDDVVVRRRHGRRHHRSRRCTRPSIRCWRSTRGNVTTPTPADLHQLLGRQRSAAAAASTSGSPATSAGASLPRPVGRCGTFSNRTCRLRRPAGLSSTSPRSRMTSAPSPSPRRAARGPTQAHGLRRASPAAATDAAFDATVWFRWTAPSRAGQRHGVALRHRAVPVHAGRRSPLLACSDGAAPRRSLSRAAHRTCSPATT